ncbi:hypothetical protein C823_005612 [Eubacterium plexicaudatum ASF492]|nr:hypothetical protein C823_005612 [Eubacterium plexicaudatum ASF492]
MSQDFKEKAEKKSGQMIKISFVSLLIVLLFVIEMYEIINDPANMIVIGSLGAFLLVSVLVEMLLIGKLIEKRAKDQEEAFDNVYRSEKASYLLMRKCFDQMEQKMDNLGDLSNIPYKELIAAQKALAKAQINRNKQNTNALLISNDRMMQKLTSMQSDLSDILENTANIDNKANEPMQEINSGFNEQDRANLQDGNRDILQKQQEILQNIQQLETSLRNEILDSANKVASIKSKQMSAPELQMQIHDSEEQIAPLDIDGDNSILQPQMELGGMEDLESLDLEENHSALQSQMELDGLEDLDSLDIKPDSLVSQPQMELDGLGEPDALGEPLLSLDIEEDMPMAQATEQADELIAPLDLDLENDFPLAAHENLKKTSQNSSESNLDKLLQQINTPKSSEPELQPIEQEAVPEFITDDLTLQSDTEEPELQQMILDTEPIVEETVPELQPIMEEAVPELQPMMEELATEPELQPIMEETIPELQPMMEEVVPEPMPMEPELQSIMGDTVPEMQSMMEEAVPELQPIMEEPVSELQPIMEEAVPESQPVMEEAVPELQPIMEEPVSELQPIMEEAVPELQPVMEEAVSEPTIPELVSEPVISEPESETVIEPSVTESVALDPDLQAILEKSKMQQPTVPDLTSFSKTEEPVKEKQTESISSGTEITPDKLAAMVANLGNDMKLEPEAAADTEKEAFMAETLDPVVTVNTGQSYAKTSASMESEDELEKLMKEMKIDNIPDQSLEDLDIDKILEFPMENGKSGSNQVMSSEEIAALIANTELLSDPEPAKHDNMMDLTDTSHVMSSDEIAALIANM